MRAKVIYEELCALVNRLIINALVVNMNGDDTANLLRAFKGKRCNVFQVCPKK